MRSKRLWTVPNARRLRPAKPGDGASRTFVLTAPGSALRELARDILGRDLSDQETELFDKYRETLIKWQRSQRLVGSSDPRWIETALFADALIFERFVPETAHTLLDFGSGAGLPGIPLKIVRRDLDVVLLESRAKRVSFLRSVVRELGLTGIRVIGERADAASGLDGRFDVVTARCAGTLEKVIAGAVPFLNPTGLLLVGGPPHPGPQLDLEWTSVALRGGDSRNVGILRRRPPLP